MKFKIWRIFFRGRLKINKKSRKGEAIPCFQYEIILYSDIDAKSTRPEEEYLEILHLKPRLFFSRAFKRVCIRHSGLVWSQLLVTRLLASVCRIQACV